MAKTISDLVFFNEANVAPEKYHGGEEKRVKGNPQQSLWNYYSDASDQFHVGEWEAEVGSWKVSYTEHEFCQILHGVSILHGNDGTVKELKAGDNFVVPAGFEGVWEVVEPTKKIYVIFEPTA